MRLGMLHRDIGMHLLRWGVDPMESAWTEKAPEVTLEMKPNPRSKCPIR
jgi:hypothetical protein